MLDLVPARLTAREPGDSTPAVGIVTVRDAPAGIAPSETVDRLADQCARARAWSGLENRKTERRIDVHDRIVDGPPLALAVT